MVVVVAAAVVVAIVVFVVAVAVVVPFSFQEIQKIIEFIPRRCKNRTQMGPEWWPKWYQRLPEQPKRHRNHKEPSRSVSRRRTRSIWSEKGCPRRPKGVPKGPQNLLKITKNSYRFSSRSSDAIFEAFGCILKEKGHQKHCFFVNSWKNEFHENQAGA